MSFDLSDILLIFFSGFFACSFMYDTDETCARYLKDGMNKKFYWSLMNECLSITIAFSCLLEVASDRFEIGLIVFPINFFIEYIVFKYTLPFVKKLLKKGRTKDADSI